MFGDKDKKKSFYDKKTNISIYKKTYIYNTNKQNYLSGIYNVEYPINNRKNRRKKTKNSFRRINRYSRLGNPRGRSPQVFTSAIAGALAKRAATNEHIGKIKLKYN